MKKILFLLLISVSLYGQNPTPFSKIKITNNVQDTIATKVTVQDANGVQNWRTILSLPVSTATQTAIDNKVFDFINNGATTIAPSQNAVFDALALKRNIADNPTLQQVTTSGATTNKAVSITLPQGVDDTYATALTLSNVGSYDTNDYNLKGTTLQVVSPDYGVGVNSYSGYGTAFVGTSDDGNAFNGVSGNGTAFVGNSFGGTAFVGNSFGGTAFVGNSDYGTAFNGYSNTSIPAIFNLPTSNTSNITEFRKNNVAQASISHDGKLTAKGVIHSGNIIPTGSLTSNIGSSSLVYGTTFSSNFAGLSGSDTGIKGGSGIVFFVNNNVSKAKFFSTTGHLALNNGGAFVDDGVNRIQVDGSIKSTSLTLSTTPTTSAGTYDIITRNTTTGVVEKVASSAITAGSLLTTTNQSFTGIKSATNTGSDITTGIELINNGDAQGILYLVNNSAGGTQVIDNNSTGIGSIIYNNSTAVGQFIHNNSSGIGLYLQNNSSGTAFRAVGGVASTGNLYEGRNLTTTTFSVNKTGDIVANSYTGNASLTNVPTAPTATVGTNTTQIATTAFVLANSNANGILEYNATDKTVWNNGRNNIANNTSFGENVLAAGALSGDNNTGYGTNALRYLTTGSGNLALGQSGLHSSVGLAALTSCTNSIFIGNAARALGNGNTNEIVVGNGTEGFGSNSITLGTTATTKTILRGVITYSSEYTVATLPTPTGKAFAVVTDATAPTYLGTLTGGGAVVCPVFYNGTAWVSH